MSFRAKREILAGRQRFLSRRLSRSFEPGSFEMTDLSAYVYGYDARSQTVAIHPRRPVRHAERVQSMSFRAKREILARRQRFLSRRPLTFVRARLLRNDECATSVGAKGIIGSRHAVGGASPLPRKRRQPVESADINGRPEIPPCGSSLVWGPLPDHRGRDLEAVYLCGALEIQPKTKKPAGNICRRVLRTEKSMVVAARQIKG